MAQSSLSSNVPALGSSFALFRFLTISEMDDLVPFLRVWRGHRQSESSWEALRGFQKLRGSLVAAHIFQFPPTKNLRAMMGNWFLRVSLRL